MCKVTHSIYRVVVEILWRASKRGRACTFQVHQHYAVEPTPEGILLNIRHRYLTCMKRSENHSRTYLHMFRIVPTPQAYPTGIVDGSRQMRLTKCVSNVYHFHIVGASWGLQNVYLCNTYIIYRLIHILYRGITLRIRTTNLTRSSCSSRRLVIIFYIITRHGVFDSKIALWNISLVKREKHKYLERCNRYRYILLYRRLPDISVWFKIHLVFV